MTELAAAAASFPVVFFDGDREVDFGTIAVHPSLGFRKFQALISQKIGLSPNQISTSLVRRKKARPSPEIRRKVPIDESSDFSAIARERDCFVLAVLRRSRGGRRSGRMRRDGEESEMRAAAASGSPQKTILKRNPGGDLAALIPDINRRVGLWDFQSQLRNLQRQRERYLLSTSMCYPYPSAKADAEAEAAVASGPPPPPAVAAVCEECLVAKEGRAPPFHSCVYDAVTQGFRSPVGPIQRPPKKHVEASA